MTPLREGRLRLYSVFHLNIAYSSIEESQRPEVVDRCYWPLLELAKRRSLPFGFEIPAYTLETIAAIDPRWVKTLRDLWHAGVCEFVGSGYAQLIGPLVPAEVNAANLRLGNAAYERLLGRRPDIALVNEQAYSAGLVRHYVDARYRAIIMEWDNPYKHHPEWDPRLRYFPQRALGPEGEEIPLLWNKSIAFQKFQRYAHGEMELDEYLAYLRGHAGQETRAFPLYANDVEIFDFRPGRYHTEAPLQEDGEWKRLDRLFAALSSDDEFELVSPSAVLGMIDAPGAGLRLRMESPEAPIPVKKQGKYNVVRWAVTGRDDVGINTACRRVYEDLSRRSASDAEWRELCYLWSSDFRTHITEKRWRAYRRRLASFERRLRIRSPRPAPMPRTGAKRLPRGAERTGRFLKIRAGDLTVRLNEARGLAIDGIWLGSTAAPPLVGTLHHGFYDDISLGSDWYTGHVVLEAPGRPKISDLAPIAPAIGCSDGLWNICGTVQTPLGPVKKSVSIDGRANKVRLYYRFDWKESPMGSLRLGNITLDPRSFDKASLYYATHNGGLSEERFPLAGRSVNHGAPVSFLVSANCALGMTTGRVVMGDSKRRVTIDSDQTCASLVGMVNYRETRNSYFARLALSAGEMDETRRPDGAPRRPLDCRISLGFE